jgi:Ca2+/Na+ antiporter
MGLYMKKIMKIKREKAEQDDATPFADKDCSGKLFTILDFPFIWMRKLTIPPCEKDHYAKNKSLVIIWPFLGIPVMGMLAKNSWPNSWGWLYYLPIAVLWALYFWKAAKIPKDAKPAVPKAYILVQVVGMFTGFVWTYYASGMLIDILTMIGVLSKLSATYLALTIIAIGNALPDAIITIALAK